MKKNKKNLLMVTLCLLGSLLLLQPQSVSASQASLSLSPAGGGSYQVGSTFSVGIWAKTGENNVDSVRASLVFPANILEVQSIALQAYGAPMGGNYFDNNSGVIYWGGGFYGGTTADSSFATIQFKAKSAGSATVSFADNSLMLSAGQSVPITKAGATYTIVSMTPAPTVTSPAPKTTATPKSQTTVATPTTQAPQKTPISNSLNPISNEIGNSPTFSGKTNIGGAKVTIIIDDGLFTQEVVADENGNWSWTLENKINPGEYGARIIASDPQDSENSLSQYQGFEIVVKEAMEVLFDVILDIDKSTKKINAGDKLKFYVKLLNFGEGITSDSITNVDFEYIIEGQGKQQVFKVSEKRQVLGREGNFEKIIEIPSDIKPGQYSLFAKMSYGDNQEASSLDSFEVSKQTTSPVYVILAIVAILIAVWGVVRMFTIEKGTRKKKSK